MPRIRMRRRPPALAEGARRFVVLACAPDDTTAIDLATGAIARLHVDWPDDTEVGLSPFDLIDALVKEPECEDLAQPEAVTIEGVPEQVGSVRRRRARRLLRRVAAPAEQHLLGIVGSATPYWELEGMRPSVAIVVPSRGPVLFRRRSDGSTWARFGWPRSDNWLPVEDRRAIGALWASGRERLFGKDLANALGFRPNFVVVTLSSPRDGHCYKTVAAILPRP